MNNQPQQPQTQALAPRAIGEQVIHRLDEKCQTGLTFPEGYNYNNAVNAAMIKLQEMRDKSGRSALETCTPVSISQALFKMATKGLDVTKNQCYFIVRGNQLCCDDSYFGKILQVRRIYPKWTPLPRVIFRSDDFVYAIDPRTARRVIVRHEQAIENFDEAFDIENGFRGAYMYYPLPDGSQDLFLMTNKQIRKAWAKSRMAGLDTHKAFTVKMIEKTVINSCCNMIINSQPEFNEYDAPAPDIEDTVNAPAVEVPVADDNVEVIDYADIDEVNPEDVAPVQPAEPQQPKEQPTTDDYDF